MNEASLSAILLFAAALIQSTSYLCNRLPEARCPAWYPRNRLARTVLDLSWILLFAVGALAAFHISPSLALVAGLLYFLVLPFVFQPTLARLLGFRSLRELVAYLDSP